MLVMVVFFIAFRWIHLSTLLIRLFLLVMILLLMPTLNFLSVWSFLNFFIAFSCIHLSTPLIRFVLLVMIFLLMPSLNFLPVWFALSLLRFRLPSRLPMMFILWMVAMMVVIIPSRTV